MKNTFLPQVKLIGNNLVLNNEAVETMNLDSKESKITIIKVENPDSKKLPKEILIVKTNGSTLDNPQDVADLISPDKIRLVQITELESGEKNGIVAMGDRFPELIQECFGDEREFKLVICNVDNKVVKEFKEVFDISESYYRITKMSDKRTVLGKDKSLIIKNEERLKL
jgi:hypothetical protein